MGEFSFIIIIPFKPVYQSGNFNQGENKKSHDVILDKYGTGRVLLV